MKGGQPEPLTFETEGLSHQPPDAMKKNGALEHFSCCLGVFSAASEAVGAKSSAVFLPVSRLGVACCQPTGDENFLVLVPSGS